MDSERVRVFISYTHDSTAHKQRVLELADRLREEGIDCHLDQYETSPPEGWPRWMQNQIDESTFVIVVCTETYERRFRGREETGKGLGAQWEGAAITQQMYDAAAHNTKFIPIAFSSEDTKYVPSSLRGATHYRVDNEEGYEDLYRRLTDQRKAVKPPLGQRRVFEPVNAKPREGETIAKAAEPVQPHITQPSSTLTKPPVPLSLIYLFDGQYMFVALLKAEVGDKTTLRLSPENPRQSVFLSGVKRTARQSLAVAFSNKAMMARVESVTQIHESSSEQWSLVLVVEDVQRDVFMEMTFNNYTPETIAELRARKILLNEEPELGNKWQRDDLMIRMVRSQISNSDGPIEVTESPLLALYREFQGEVEAFLSRAKLMCVLHLILTGVVEHIFTLELRMAPKRR